MPYTCRHLETLVGVQFIPDTSRTSGRKALRGNGILCGAVKKARIQASRGDIH